MKKKEITQKTTKHQVWISVLNLFNDTLHPTKIFIWIQQPKITSQILQQTTQKKNHSKQSI